MSATLPFPNRPLPMLVYFARQTPFLTLIFLILPALLLSFYALLPYATKLIIDTLGKMSPGQADGWTALALPLSFFFGLLVLRLGANALLWRVGYRLRFSLLARMRGALFAHVQRHASGWFDDELSGKVAHKLMLLPEQLMQILERTAWEFLPTFVMALVTAVLLASAGWGFSVGIFFWVVIYFFTCALRGTVCMRRAKEHNNAKTMVTGRVADAIANVRSLIAFAHHHQEDVYLDGFIQQEKACRRRLFIAYTQLRLSQYLLDILLWAGMLTGGLWAWLQGALTTGDVVMMVGSVTILSRQIWGLGDVLTEAFDNYGSACEGAAMLVVPHQMPDAPDAKALVVKGGEVRFEHVKFSYPDGTMVFSDLNLIIPAGQKMGLVGASGVGKSTLASLLLRLYDVQDGRILIDGQDIRRVTQESLRSQVALIPQDTTLFHRTLRENIAYGRPGADDASLLNAAQAAHADEFIRRLPQGYDSMVGERGVKLSGGQRQRLAVARALLKDAPILLLDEATSALDSESESAIQDSLKLAMQGRTVVAIAHRLSTIMHLDRLVVLGADGIVEDGTHAQLLELNGIYAGLWRRQSGGFLQEDDAPTGPLGKDAPESLPEENEGLEDQSTDGPVDRAVTCA